MDEKDPLGYPLLTYVWVVSIACIAGLVRHLNTVQKFSACRLLIDIITASFTGVVAFWLCEAYNIKGPMMAVMIATAGLMGNRCWKELENVWRMKLGIGQNRKDDEAPK